MAQTRKTTENPGTAEPNSSPTFGASATGGGRSPGATAPAAPASTQRSTFAAPAARPAPAPAPVAPARGNAFAGKSIESKPRAAEPTHQAIEEAAYFLWLKRGGDEILNWLEAESAVRAKLQKTRA